MAALVPGFHLRAVSFGATFPNRLMRQAFQVLVALSRAQSAELTASLASNAEALQGVIVIEALVVVFARVLILA